MLANVMPGLRELRAPLAAGYVWLIFGWMAFGDALRQQRDLSDPVKRLYELEPVVSSLGIAVAASVAAYLIGSIAIDLQSQVGRRRRSRQEREFDELDRTDADEGANIRGLMWTTSGAGYDVLNKLAVELQQELDSEVYPEGGRVVQAFVSANRAVLKVRLLDLSPALHGEVDRPDAEATFRMGLWPPLAAVVVLLGLTTSWWWLFALLVPTVMAAQWWKLRNEANEALGTAVAARPELRDLVRANLGAWHERQDGQTASSPEGREESLE